MIKSISISEEHDQLTPERGPLYGKNFLSIPDSTSEDEISQIGRAIQSVSEANAWWIGDFILHVSRIKEAQLRARLTAEGLEGERIEARVERIKREHYTHLFHSFGFNVETLKRAKYVCGKIAPAERLPLSFNHHLEALQLTKTATRQTDSTAALEWLRAAHENGWTVKDMRTAINAASAREKVKLDLGEQAETRLDILDALNRVEKYLKNAEESEAEWIAANVTPKVREIQTLLSRLPLLLEIQKLNGREFKVSVGGMR